MSGGNSAGCAIKFDGRHFYLGDRGCGADTGEHHAGEIKAIMTYRVMHGLAGTWNIEPSSYSVTLRGRRMSALSMQMPTRNSRDVVFTFFMESWTNAAGREMYMTGPRLVATLMSEPTIGRLLVANPFRSTPIQWARKIMGQRPPSFPGDVCHALVEPRRIRRRDPTSVQALERAYAAYDRTLEAAAADLGADRPVIITTNPLVAGFSPLRWAGQVTFYAWDDWPAALALHRWWTAYDEAFARIREFRSCCCGCVAGRP